MSTLNTADDIAQEQIEDILASFYSDEAESEPTQLELL